jgi:hypothetical protein
MKILKWKKFARGTMRGFLDLELTVENGRTLEVYEWVVHVNERGSWISPPGRPQIDKDGNLRKLPGKTRPEYAVMMKWSDDETRNHFNRAVLKILLEQYPDALEANG